MHSPATTILTIANSLPQNKRHADFIARKTKLHHHYQEASWSGRGLNETICYVQCTKLRSSKVNSVNTAEPLALHLRVILLYVKVSPGVQQNQAKKYPFRSFLPSTL